VANAIVAGIEANAFEADPRGASSGIQWPAPSIRSERKPDLQKRARVRHLPLDQRGVARRPDARGSAGAGTRMSRG
jgi:hypothetical protein